MFAPEWVHGGNAAIVADDGLAPDLGTPSSERICHGRPHGSRPRRLPRLIFVAGELDLATAPALHAALVGLSGGVIVDCTDLGFLDSAGFYCLDRGYNSAVARQSTFKSRASTVFRDGSRGSSRCLYIPGSGKPPDPEPGSSAHNSGSDTKDGQAIARPHQSGQRVHLRRHDPALRLRRSVFTVILLQVHLRESRSGSLLEYDSPDTDRGGEPLEDLEPQTNPSIDELEDQVDAVTEKLQHKFAGVDGPLSDDEVTDVVHDANAELRDAPVQAFVPIIAENNARNRLQERADEADHGH